MACSHPSTISLGRAAFHATEGRHQDGDFNDAGSGEGDVGLDGNALSRAQSEVGLLAGLQIGQVNIHQAVHSRCGEDLMKQDLQVLEVRLGRGDGPDG
jgi:hypothetical protein